MPLEQGIGQNSNRPFNSSCPFNLHMGFASNDVGMLPNSVNILNHQKSMLGQQFMQPQAEDKTSRESSLIMY